MAHHVLARCPRSTLWLPISPGLLRQWFNVHISGRFLYRGQTLSERRAMLRRERLGLLPASGPVVSRVCVFIRIAVPIPVNSIHTARLGPAHALVERQATLAYWLERDLRGMRQMSYDQNTKVGDGDDGQLPGRRGKAPHELRVSLNDGEEAETDTGEEDEGSASNVKLGPCFALGQDVHDHEHDEDNTGANKEIDELNCRDRWSESCPSGSKQDRSVMACVKLTMVLSRWSKD